ncbi:MAG: acetyl/propionyl/methylcrotonyl-CoA carboxylase subunit alpha [Vicinamibacterales bacterium]
MLTRVLVANRGEIAVRIIRACRELGLESVAVYSEVDANAQHVLLADRAVPIGPATPGESYLSIPRIIAAARATGADAIHPGYGFLSENAELAAACEREGIAFVGPPWPVIARMGSKIESRRLMESAGVPVVPGETPEDQSDAGVRRAIERVGLPALVKASAGGGGKGMRRVTAAGQIDEAIQAARREAQHAFDDGTLYVERLIERPHHVEVQIMADHHGAVVHLFERECSIQRRHQKVLEESPSPTVTPALRARLVEAAVQAARAAGYRNAGTIEFLVDLARAPDPRGADGVPPFYFLEMNTRLQVEHPVTESVSGVDLVHAQLRVAAGEPLPWPQEALSQRGHAIEARVYAESPARGFLPQAGPLLVYREPRMPGVRVDTGVIEGDRISVHYDPLVAKVIASAETRDMAIERLSAALRAFPILGIETNVPFILRILEHPAFRSGEVDTGFLDAAPALAMDPDGALPEPVRLAFSAHARAGAAAATGAPDEWDPWSSRRGARP